MKDPLEPQRAALQWVVKAEHDLINAEHTLKLGEECPYDTVCFHAQQCAEKYLKALLTVRLVSFSWTHDLRVLLQLVPDDANLKIVTSDLLTLNRYSMEARYPGNWDPITEDEARAAVCTARQMRDAIRILLEIS